MLGHSLGSFLAVTLAIKWGPLLSGVLLSGTGSPSPLVLKSGKAAITAASTTFGTKRSLFMINALCFAGYALSVKKPKTEFDCICSDPAFVKEFMSNPKSQFLYSNGFYLDLIAGLLFNSNSANLYLIPPELPFYYFSGAEDPLGDQTKGVIKAANRLSQARVQDITTRLYDGLRHEILNEVNRDIVYNDLYRWINLHISNKLQP
jgi:alpha-beta hydrolase superfamily lysophospholipase